MHFKYALNNILKAFIRHVADSTTDSNNFFSSFSLAGWVCIRMRACVRATFSWVFFDAENNRSIGLNGIWRQFTSHTQKLRDMYIVIRNMNRFHFR